MVDGESNVAVAVPAPDGEGDIHTLRLDVGMINDPPITTNRAYFNVRGELELTAAECRKIASKLEFAAAQLDAHHDVRMPVVTESEE